MSNIVWNEQLYGIGIEELDEQHKQLVDLLNSLIQSINRGEHDEAVKQALRGMVDYVSYHFAAEEDLMNKVDYPDFESHRKQHNAFVVKITNYLKRMQSGQELSAFELVSFLKTWLLRHIAGSDRNIARYIKTVQAAQVS